MKKLTLAIAIVLGMTIGASAQNNGLYQRGFTSDEMQYGANNRNSELVLPSVHGSPDDANGTPVGSGIVVLMGLGAAYAFAKKRNND